MTGLLLTMMLTTAATLCAYLTLAPPQTHQRLNAILAGLAVLFAIMAVRS